MRKTEDSPVGISLLIVEHQEVFRNALIEMLGKHTQIVQIRGTDRTEAALKLLRKERFDIVLLDIDMPLGNGMDILDGILAMKFPPRALAMSIQAEGYHIMQAYEKGVYGYVLKSNFTREILTAMQVVISGRHYYNPETAGFLLEVLARDIRKSNYIDESLSEQEKKVLYYICHQLTNGEIAKELCLAEYTVMRHKQNIKEKIKARNLVGYVTYALKNNIVRLTEL
jgi:DNA-binding NarL/FixJ family response regulator